MQFLPQIIFLAFTSIAIGLFSKNLIQIRRNILLGKSEDLSDQPSQ